MIRFGVLALTVAIGFASHLHRTRWLELAEARGAGSWDPFVLAALTFAGAATGLWLAGLACARLPEHLDVAHVRARGLVWVGGTFGIGALWAAFVPFAIVGIHWLVGGVGRAAEGGLLAFTLFPAAALLSAPLPWIAQALSRTPRFPGPAFSRVLAAFAGGVALATIVREPAAEAGFGLTGGMGWVAALQLATAAGFAAFGLLGDWRSPRAPDPPQPPRREPVFGFVPTSFAAVLYGYGLALFVGLLQRIGSLALGGGPLAEAIGIATFAGGLSLGAAVLGWAEWRLRRQLAPALLAAAALLLVYGHATPDAGYWAHYLRVVFVDEAASYMPFHVVAGLCTFVILLPLAMLLGSIPASLLATFEREDWAAGRRAATVMAWIAVGAAVGSVAGAPLWLRAAGLQGTATACVLLLAATGGVVSALRLGRARIIGLGVAAVVAVAALATPEWPLERLMLGLSNQRRALPESFGGPDRFFARTTPEETRPLRFTAQDLEHSVAVAQLAPSRRALLVDGDVLTALPQDEKVLTMLALLPAWLTESPRSALVVGARSGLVARRLAAVPGIEDVEVVDGSPAVVAAQAAFDDLLPELPEALRDRVHYRVADPRRSLQRSSEQHDIIVVAPHAWWARDAVRLLDRESVQHARSRLRPGGVYVHWLPRWGGDEHVLASFLASMRTGFDAVSLWKPRRTQWIVVGFVDPEGEARPGHFAMERLKRRFREPAIRRPLARQRIRTLGALLAHEATPVGVIGRVPLPTPIRVIDHPGIRRQAARSWFAGAVADPPSSLRREIARIADENSLLRQYRRWRGPALEDRERTAISEALCDIDAAACAGDLMAWHREAPGSRRMRDAWGQARFDGHFDGLPMDVLDSLVMPGVAAQRRPSYRNALESRTVFQRFYSHLAPLDPALLVDLWQRCAREEPRCAEELDSVQGLGVPWQP